MKPFDWFKRKVSDDDLRAYPERTALEAQATSLLTTFGRQSRALYAVRALRRQRMTC
jgi:hypothetical protein